MWCTVVTHTHCTCMHVVGSEKISIHNQFEIEVNEICQVRTQSSLSISELAPGSRRSLVFVFFRQNSALVNLYFHIVSRPFSRTVFRHIQVLLSSRRSAQMLSHLFKATSERCR